MNEIPKRRGRPPKIRPENMQEITPDKPTLLLNPDSFKEIKSGPPPSSDAIKAVHSVSRPAPTLGELCVMIDAAPNNWLPTVLSKIVKRSLKEKLWSDSEQLILSVRGFSKP